MPGNELIGKEELKSIKEIFTRSGGVLFAHGFEERRNNIFRVRELEKKAAYYFQSKYCVATSSGTTALYSALKALNIGPGDEVITQAYTFVATVEAILATGASPIIANIDKTLNICPKHMENLITKKTKCIIPVHMQGNPARMDEIIKISNKYKIPIIEDSCQAIGAKYKEKHCGTIGNLGTFSLDFGKAITGGEGGFIFTNNIKHYKYTRAFTDHGHDNNPKLPRGKDTSKMWGMNFRMTELQAAVLDAQLKKLDFILERNRRNKKFLKDILQKNISNLVEFREITDPKELADGVIFYLPNKKITKKVMHDLYNKGVGFKNVPDAMRWHCTSFWSQIWKDNKNYKYSYKKEWKNTLNLLERTLSFSINVLHKKTDLKILSDKIIKSVVKNS
jgi:8-amino-3,8-dideoxy-alpha-D-manno-octulosonate transaminase